MLLPRLTAIVLVSSLFVPVVMAQSGSDVQKHSQDFLNDPVVLKLDAINKECRPLRQKQEKINADRFIKRYANKKGYSDNRYVALMLKNDGDALYKLGMEEYEKRPQSKKHLQNAYMLFASAALRQQSDAAKMQEKVKTSLSDDAYIQATLRLSHLSGPRKWTLLAVGLPKKCDGSTRDLARRVDLNLFIERVVEYAKENGGLPEKIPLNKPTELCGGYQEPCDGRVDLREELLLIPRDPSMSGTKIGAATRYFISRTADGKVIMSAPDAEIDPITMNGSSK